MILPDKYTASCESLIYISAIILKILCNKSIKVERLFSKFKSEPHIVNKQNCFNSFIYALVFMRTCGFISINEEGEIINENSKP